VAGAAGAAGPAGPESLWIYTDFCDSCLCANCHSMGLGKVESLSEILIALLTYAVYLAICHNYPATRKIHLPNVLSIYLYISLLASTGSIEN